MLRNAPLLLVSQYQLTSPTSLGLGFSGHSKRAIFFFLRDHFCCVLVCSCKAVLRQFFISDFLRLNPKLVVLLIVCHPYLGLAVLRLASVSTAH